MASKPAPKKNIKKETKSRLIVLDSHAIIHRAYHALPDFVSTTGEPTGALYGLSTMLMKIVIDLKPDYIVAAYDLPQKTFRHEAYKEYKAGRIKADEALIAQLKSSRRIFEAFNIPIYDCPGFEADDILGTIVKELKTNKDVDIIIASGDMDTLQLVDDKRVQVFTLKRGLTDTIMYDEDAVRTRFGFGPELLPDYKGLRGDPSDNIIGIKGIGEKTATILITTFGTIEKMYKALKKDTEMFTKVGITPRIIELLKEGEDEALFSKTLATIRRDAPIKFALPEKKFLENFDATKTEELFRELEFRSLISKAKAFDMTSVEMPTVVDEEETSDEDKEKFDKLAIALWLLNSDMAHIVLDDVMYFAGSKNMKEGEQKILDAIEKAGLHYVYYDMELPIYPIVKDMERHGVLLDTKYLAELSKKYHTELSKLEKSIYAHAGHEFNINSPKQLGVIIFDELGLTADKGVRMKKTSGGARSTKESELEKLKNAHPIIEEIFKHREIQKLLSTYIDVLPKLVHDDGRIHAHFRQAGTTTGRFSSDDPNMQNIPIKSELGKNIRHAFIAPVGSSLVSFDYSQIELRLAALLSGDEYLLNIFKQGKDVHAAVASRVYKVGLDEVTADMRRKAKVINFGILYGMGVTALQQNLGTDRKEAQAFYDNYFAEFPSIRGYLDGVIEQATAKGYTETLFGRRRYFPGLRSKIPFIKAMAERMAVNAPIQGTSADLIKLAIRDSNVALAQAGFENDVHLIMQVHDEIVFEVKNDLIEKVSQIVEKAMIDVIPAEYGKDRIVLEAHVSSGRTFGELK